MSVTPYYQEDGITIYHADCLEVFPLLDHVDLLLTDPPYGLNIGVMNNLAKSGGHGGHLGKRSYASYEDTYQNFVDAIISRLNHAISLAKRSIVFTGPHIHEQRKPDAIGGIFCPVATGRTAWGSKNFLPILFYGRPPNAGQHRPTVLYSTATSKPSTNPCPKPLSWMLWLINLGSQLNECILDPFMGSGVTLLAAKELGRQAIGCEINERDCETAVKRLQQEVLDFGPPPGSAGELPSAQGSLFPEESPHADQA